MTSVALARDPRLPERYDVLALGDLAAHRPVVELRLEDDHRIGVADRRGEQPLGVGRRRGDRHLHARRVHVVGLGRVVVQLGGADAAAVRHAHYERELHRAARPPAVAPDVRDQLVEARVREGVVLHLADRPPARHAEPDRAAEDARLRERRVDAALGAEAVEQPGGRAEDAAGAADVLAHDHHVRVAPELDVERVVDRLDERQLSHEPHPRCLCSSARSLTLFTGAQTVVGRRRRSGSVTRAPRILRSSARSAASDGGGSAYAFSKTSAGIRRRLGLGLGDSRRASAPRPRPAPPLRPRPRGARAGAGRPRSGRGTRAASPPRRAARSMYALGSSAVACGAAR